MVSIGSGRPLFNRQSATQHGYVSILMLIIITTFSTFVYIEDEFIITINSLLQHMFINYLLI